MVIPVPPGPAIAAPSPLPTIAADRSAVSWSAIFAGAAAAAALSLVLLALGTGLGLSAISPWQQHGPRAAAFGFASIAWVIVTQLCASALGGYIAGRLRTRWADVERDEVYFRDTVHGLLAWAVASLAITALLALTPVAAVAAANAVIAAAESSEEARRAGIQAALWLFIALLSGAFIASCTAVLGGRERDR